MPTDSHHETNLFATPKPTLTYVSCFVNINCKEPHKTHQWRIDNFLHIAKTGVPIILYVDTEIRTTFAELWAKHPNVLLRDVDYTSSWTFKVCAKYEHSLPSYRNEIKDSFLFICLMNMKIEFVANAVNENPFNTTHFAWIDFNLTHIFNRKTASCNYMKMMASCPWQPGFIANPGCWEKGQGAENLVDSINWRFCGGFMIGDGQEFINLFDLYLEHFTGFMHKYRKITWEVNFWTWLEINAGWNITWYKADHDDSIVRVPSHLFSRCLSNPVHRYALPEKPGFYPSSTAYIKTHDNKHVINVRYVNYRLDDYGRYLINHPNGYLETENLRAYLTPDLLAIEDSPEFVWSGMLDLPIYDRSIMGLEDVRLFYGGDDNDQIKYVATNKCYSASGKIRIMMGDYSASMAMFETGKILDPPKDTWCEKNWIPLPSKGNQRFIYQWAPFEIGELDNQGQLRIQMSIPIEHLLFQKVRGSTPPVWSERHGCYLCVVHYCEHGPKTLLYYHVLVKLREKDFLPIEWSDVFHFSKVGIQYCIGHTIMEDGRMAFWFSEHDGNPGLMII